jgi:hypothetical protein
MRLKFLLIIILCVILKAKAQFPVDMEYQAIYPENQIMPDYLNTIEDNSVPEAMTIKRITHYFEEWDWYPTHDYAKIQPWNADGSLYKIRALALYNATTHEEYRDLPGGDIYPVYWSNTNSNLMYSFREDGEIKKYSVDTETLEVVYTIEGYDIIKLGPGEGNIDMHDHYVALVGKRGEDMDVIVFDIQTNQILHTEIFSGAWGIGEQVPDYVDWVSVSQSGEYVGIMWNHNTTSEDNPFNSHYGVEMYSTTNMQYQRRIARYGNHGDFGFAADGDEVFVQFWGETGTINMFYLDRLERVVISSHENFNSSGHISCRNLNRPGYAYVSQDYEDHSGQIIAVKLEESGLVGHFGHHFNSYTYFAAIPVPTPNGDKVMFTSDFGNNENEDEIYVFETTISEVLNIDGIESLSVDVFPNPTTNNITINSHQKLTKIELYSSLGILVKSVKEVKLNTNSLHIKDLAQGVYFLKITGNNNELMTYRLIKK